MSAPVRTKFDGAPDLTVTRESGTYTAFGYRAARIADRDGRSPSMGGGVAHERYDRVRLQAQSRELRRNNAIYAGMLRRARNFILGPGFKLTPRTDDPAWNADTEPRFVDFWRRPEISGLRSGNQCASAVTDELLTCGEALTILTSLGKIQFVEAEQLRGQTLDDDGIERDKVTQAPIAYTVSPYRADGSLDFGKSIKYRAADVLYMAAPERPSSSRAVPPAQPSFPLLHMIFDVCVSEAVAWQIQSKFAVSITQKEGSQLQSVASQDENVSDDEASGSPTGKWVTHTPEATIFWGLEGEEIKGIERTAGSKSFTETLSMYFRLLGLPLGLPIELTLLDWTKSNYSQSRAVLEQVKISLLEWQLILEEFFYRPIYLWWLDREVREGRIKDRPDRERHEWVKPAFPWIDQLAESKAHGENVDRGFETFDEVCKGRNTSREAHVSRLQEEAREAAIAARALKEEFPEYDFPWEMFAGKKSPAVTVRESANAQPDGGPVPTNAPPEPAQQPTPPGGDE